jgi:hypothetical protein
MVRHDLANAFASSAPAFRRFAAHRPVVRKREALALLGGEGTLGMVCGEVTIVPDFEAMAAGCTIAADPWKIYMAWEQRSKFRGFHYESILRGRIMG